MKEKFSNVIFGLVIAGVGSLVAGFGFTDSCQGEIMEKVIPVISTLPGIVYAWIARVKQGGVTKLGFKK